MSGRCSSLRVSSEGPSFFSTSQTGGGGAALTFLLRGELTLMKWQKGRRRFCGKCAGEWTSHTFCLKACHWFSSNEPWARFDLKYANQHAPPPKPPAHPRLFRYMLGWLWYCTKKSFLHYFPVYGDNLQDKNSTFDIKVIIIHLGIVCCVSRNHWL